jgi:hypothetical protein
LAIQNGAELAMAAHPAEALPGIMSAAVAQRSAVEPPRQCFAGLTTAPDCSLEVLYGVRRGERAVQRSPEPKRQQSERVVESLA